METNRAPNGECMEWFSRLEDTSIGLVGRGRLNRFGRLGQSVEPPYFGETKLAD